MTVYAAFMCAAGWCQMYGNTHMVGQNDFEQAPFATLAECQQYIQSATMGKFPPDENGRIVVTATNANGTQTIYWECRSKHVDTWER